MKLSKRNYAAFLAIGISCGTLFDNYTNVPVSNWHPEFKVTFNYLNKMYTVTTQDGEKEKVVRMNKDELHSFYKEKLASVTNNINKLKEELDISESETHSDINKSKFKM